jgi:hypothetical protein
MLLKAKYLILDVLVRIQKYVRFLIKQKKLVQKDYPNLVLLKKYAILCRF